MLHYTRLKGLVSNKHCSLWGSVIHQMAVPVPSISCCVLNHHNLFDQIQNALAFNWDTCCHLALCLRLLPFHWAIHKFRRKWRVVITAPGEKLANRIKIFNWFFTFFKLFHFINIFVQLGLNEADTFDSSSIPIYWVKEQSIYT